MKVAIVQLRWIDSKMSRMMPYSKRKLARPVKFGHQGREWKNNAWTVLFELEANLTNSNYQSGTARFIAKDAPDSWLVEGSEFEVYEGEIALAKGSIEAVRISDDRQFSPI